MPSPRGLQDRHFETARAAWTASCSRQAGGSRASRCEPRRTSSRSSARPRPRPPRSRPAPHGARSPGWIRPTSPRLRSTRCSRSSRAVRRPRSWTTTPRTTSHPPRLSVPSRRAGARRGGRPRRRPGTDDRDGRPRGQTNKASGCPWSGCPSPHRRSRRTPPRPRGGPRPPRSSATSSRESPSPARRSSTSRPAEAHPPGQIEIQTQPLRCPDPTCPPAPPSTPTSPTRGTTQTCRTRACPCSSACTAAYRRASARNSHSARVPRRRAPAEESEPSTISHSLPVAPGPSRRSWWRSDGRSSPFARSSPRGRNPRRRGRRRGARRGCWTPRAGEPAETYPSPRTYTKPSTRRAHPEPSPRMSERTPRSPSKRLNTSRRSRRCTARRRTRVTTPPRASPRARRTSPSFE